VYVDGEYSLFPLRKITESAAADLFVKISQRGNPILLGKPEADLELLGGALYRKSVTSVFSGVWLKGSEPVALDFAWDAGAGGVWVEGLQTPPSLLAHKAIGAAAFASLPEPNPRPLGHTMFFAFGGVSPPHPARLLWIAAVVRIQAAVREGYREMFSYMTHERTIGVGKKMQDKPGNQTWPINYPDIQTDNDQVREELANLKPGMCLCQTSDMADTRWWSGCIGDRASLCIFTCMMGRGKTKKE